MMPTPVITTANGRPMAMSPISTLMVDSTTADGVSNEITRAWPGWSMHLPRRGGLAQRLQLSDEQQDQHDDEHRAQDS
ncbi:hypothetical protein GCM10010994_22670 [Chelatococcus reniformis]|uniref:Uncharacterized protein n=2 Tax=Chelatococcus reniformis TaxID=1494448 RepID=A0A916U8Z3_9HYPH|nr:hypothetical protein GCM10010994_22670 [Chelatococcus reniformis]